MVYDRFAFCSFNFLLSFSTNLIIFFGSILLSTMVRNANVYWGLDWLNSLMLPGRLSYSFNFSFAILRLLAMLFRTSSDGFRLPSSTSERKATEHSTFFASSLG